MCKANELKIAGDNILLRRMQKKDLEHKIRWFNDPQINETLVIHEKLNLEKTYEWFEKAKNDETRSDFMIQTHLEQLIGLAGFRKIDKTNKSACIYIVIGETEYWGKGIMYEVELLLMDYGFRNLNLHKIWGDVLENNIASYVTMKKIGFHRDAILRDEYYNGKKFLDIYRFSILRDEFYKKHPKFNKI